jgi:arylsulfatase A-like enzyme
MLQRRSGAIALGAVLALAAGCTRAPQDVARGPIVLVVVDTLRADHLPCYGYGRPTAPAMCALADDGVRFARAYTTMTTTTPAIASMLTGLYPHRHGVKHLYLVLPPAMTTLTERLHAGGWATGGFISSFVMVRDFSGFEQGFDVYDDDVRTREAVRDNFQRDAATTVEHALQWLRAHGPRAFLFVHLIEPHGPYTPPSPYLERFALPAAGPEPAEMPDYQRLAGLRTTNEYVGRYDGEIASADAAIGRLLDGLRTLGWYAPATIVLVADHGESLGEEGRWFVHGTSVGAHEAHVPLVVKFPDGDAGAPPPRSEVSAPVSVVDIFPTVLRAAGVAAADDPAAASVDLAAIARGATRGAPPVTELAEHGLVTLALNGDACSVRWAVPAAAAAQNAAAFGPDTSAWFGLGQQVRPAPDGIDGGCAERTAGQAAPLIADRFRFRLDVPIVFRDDMSDGARRVRFIHERMHRPAPLADHELEALRRLGYHGDE